MTENLVYELLTIEKSQTQFEFCTSLRLSALAGKLDLYINKSASIAIYYYVYSFLTTISILLFACDYVKKSSIVLAVKAYHSVCNVF